MSILITGAAGFIGSHLAGRLLSEGLTVEGLDNFDDFYDPRIKEKNIADLEGDFSLIRGDIRDAGIYSAVSDNTETIVHIAARAGVRPSIADPNLYCDVNINGTMRLLEFARERGIRRFVFASSSSVYGNNREVPFSEEQRVDNPISPYAATKRSCELLCHAHYRLYGISCICLRFFTVFGPGQRPDLAIHKFARLMMAGEEIPVYGDGVTCRDYTYIDDILDGIEGALKWTDREEAEFEIVNLGESRTVRLHEMISILSEEMGISPKIRYLPEQPGDVEKTYADISKAKKLLNYNPRWEFRDGIREFLRWFNKN